MGWGTRLGKKKVWRGTETASLVPASPSSLCVLISLNLSRFLSPKLQAVPAVLPSLPL